MRDLGELSRGGGKTVRREKDTETRQDRKNKTAACPQKGVPPHPEITASDLHVQDPHVQAVCTMAQRDTTKTYRKRAGRVLRCRFVHVWYVLKPR